MTTASRRRRRLAVVLLAAGVLMGCATSPDRLPELDRRFYYNLPSREDLFAELGMAAPLY